jgi:CBS domain containing-hemolysin-like protein
MPPNPPFPSPRPALRDRRPTRVWAVLPLLALPAAAHASFLPPALMDKAAWGIAWFVIVVMPLAGIVLFWIVHVMPEKIAHKRHHPQREAIHVLCLLSLVFGGLLWPIAWLWAYTKPTLHRMAWGTDKHEDFFVHMADRAEAGEVGEREKQHLLDEIDAVAARGGLPPEMRKARDRIAAAPAVSPVAPAAAAAAKAEGTA